MDPSSILKLLLSSGGGGFSQLLSGLFNDQSAPFKKAEGAYNENLGIASNFMNPFRRRGLYAGRDYQNKLNEMNDPSEFLNKLIGNYQESDYTRFLKDQGQRAITNAASAGGTIGSTPYQQAGLDYNNQISQQGLNDWLSKALGLNTEYLAGQSDIYGKGLGAAGVQSGLYGNAASDLAKLAYGEEYGSQSNTSNIIGGLLQMLGAFTGNGSSGSSIGKSLATEGSRPGVFY